VSLWTLRARISAWTIRSVQSSLAQAEHTLLLRRPSTTSERKQIVYPQPRSFKEFRGLPGGSLSACPVVHPGEGKP
jgi:hypothetical protein